MELVTRRDHVLYLKGKEGKEEGKEISRKKRLFSFEGENSSSLECAGLVFSSLLSFVLVPFFYFCYCFIKLDIFLYCD